MKNTVTFTLDEYFNDCIGSYVKNVNNNPVVHIYGDGSIVVHFFICTKSVCYLSNIGCHDYCYIDLFDNYNHIVINETPPHDLIIEIMGLYNVEYDRELFNDYILKIQRYVKEIEDSLNTGIDRLINLSSNCKSANSS